jgi:hypothetical protein
MQPRGQPAWGTAWRAPPTCVQVAEHAVRRERAHAERRQLLLVDLVAQEEPAQPAHQGAVLGLLLLLGPLLLRCWGRCLLGRRRRCLSRCFFWQRLVGAARAGSGAPERNELPPGGRAWLCWAEGSSAGGPRPCHDLQRLRK